MLLDDNNKQTYLNEALCPLKGGVCTERCAWLLSSEDGCYVCAIAMIPISDFLSPMPMCQVPDVSKLGTSDPATVIGEIDELQQLNGGSGDVT